MAASRPRVVVLAGGYGGAKLSHGLALAAAERVAGGRAAPELAVIVNTGDDLEVHGLAVSPDLDTVLYTLAGWANETTGWGVRDETWSAADMLGRYGQPTWFALGDRDIAIHLVRTEALRRGERLTDVTARLARSLGVEATILPMTDDRVRTGFRVGEEWLEFQDYFVRRHHDVDVDAVRYSGAAEAHPAPEALEAIAAATLVVLAPSNPFLSIGTILAVPGLSAALRAAAAPVVAVSPIVGGAALRGPADRLLRTLGGEASAAGFAAHYRAHHPGLVDAFVIDVRDDALADPIRRGGSEEIAVMDTVMSAVPARQRLGTEIWTARSPDAGRGVTPAR